MTREEAEQVMALLRARYPNEDIRAERMFGGLRIEVYARGAFIFRADVGSIYSAVLAALERRCSQP
jgi:hypothetical protein